MVFMTELDEFIEKIKDRCDKLPLVYQWVKQRRITQKQFIALLEWIEEDNKRQLELDSY